VVAANRRFAADAVVLCAGVWSTALARQLQLKLPVRPAKGYSITLPVGAGPAPRMPVVDHGLHAAVVPVGTDRLRVAGTAEFTGMDLSISPARVANLESLLRRIYPALAARTAAADIRAWAGLRPMCADGVPLIGHTHWENLFINTGHGHLGWTLAAGSGQLIADVVAGRGGEIDVRDYAPDRV
jgi:D-amino-acid dehydrogenase